MVKKMVPEVRFEGFEDEWKTSKIKDLASISTGKSNTEDNVSYGQYPFYVRSETIERSNQYLFDEEAVLTVGDGVGTGKVFHYVNGKYDLHQRVYRIFNFNKNISAKCFYFYFSEYFYQRVMGLTAKTSVDSVRYEMISEMDVKLPSQDEQEYINNFFTKIEEKILHSEQELQKLKNFKQAMLQKMFPKEGETVPEVRFEGFSDEWELNKLKEISNIISGGTPDTTIPEYWDGDINWYSPTEIGKSAYTKASTRKITQLGLEKSSANLLPKDRTVLFTSRAGIGDMAILKNSGATNQGFQSLVLKDDIDAYFIYSIGFQIKKYANKNASGSTFMEISGKRLGEMELRIPSKDEQLIIGSFFKSLDNKIELEDKKLQKLKQFKKAMLQKMFV